MAPTLDIPEFGMRVIAPEATTPDTCKQTKSTKRALFEDAVKKRLDIPTSYLKVAVLVIRWDEKIDQYAEGHTEEVSLNPMCHFLVSQNLTLFHGWYHIAETHFYDARKANVPRSSYSRSYSKVVCDTNFR